MSNINNKHIPEDLDSLTRKDMVELFKIQVEEHQGFIKEIESLRTQLAKANERVKELEALAEERAEFIINASNMASANEVYKRCKFPLKVAVNKFAIEKKIEELETSREDFYQKIAYLASDFLLDGTTCKKVAAWFDVRIEKLRKKQEHG